MYDIHTDLLLARRTSTKEIIIGTVTGKNTHEIYFKYLNSFYFTFNLYLLQVCQSASTCRCSVRIFDIALLCSLLFY
jgi:hypothetical protein